MLSCGIPFPTYIPSLEKQNELVKTQLFLIFSRQHIIYPYEEDLRIKYDTIIFNIYALIKNHTYIKAI